YLMYCTQIDWFKPYFAMISCACAGVRLPVAISVENGDPGSSRSTTKITEMATRVRTAEIAVRLTRNRLKSLMNRLPCRPLLYRATAGRILFVSFVFTRRMVARRKIRLAEFGSALVGVPVPNTLDERGPRPSVRESEGTVVAPRVARLPQDRSCGLRVVPVPLDIRVVPVFEYRRDRVFALYGGSAIQNRLDEAFLVDGLRQRHPELF